MGVGFKVGGSGYFKSILSVVANPGAVVTIESDTSTQQKTADNNGKTSFIIKRKGHYTVTTNFGANAAIDILAHQNYSINVVFNATVTVQANPSAVVTLTNYNNSSIYYRATANSSTGIAVVSVKRAGSYTVSSNNAGGFTADGNTNSVTVNTNGSSQTIQFVRLNVPGSLTVANYSSNALTAYWTRPGSLWNGVNLRRNTGSAPASRSAGTSVYTGAGNTGIAINSSSSVNGFTNTGLTANTKYYYSIFSYITINGNNYWATTYRTANGTATNYVGTTVTITATNNAWAVPTGWRQIKVCIVGGGGAGGQGGAGGGGGYVTNTSPFSVTPGQSFAVIIGSGGAINTADNSRGGTGGQSKFGSYTANGGTGGIGKSGDITTSKKGGGSGGSGGGGVCNTTSSDSTGGHHGADGGSNGGNGGYTISSSSVTTPSHARHTGGNGQGTTTKAFTNGTTYAGGGGGGGSSYRNSHSGAGGSYGGGKGGGGYQNYVPGTAGTANSGGGGGGGYVGAADVPTLSGGAGGSGVVLVQCVA